MNFKLISLALIGVTLFFLVLLPFFGSPYSLVLLSNIFMYVVLTVTWVMFCGPTGYISLATSAFFGAGIYTAAVISFKVPLLLTVLVGALISFFLALIIGIVSLRLKGIYFAMFTFGFVELLLHFLLWYETNITGTTGRVVLTLSNQTVYYMMLALAFVTIVFTQYLNNSRYGMALKSIGENEMASEHIGIDTAKLKILTYCVSSSFVGACGVVMATRWTYVDPKIAFNPLYSFIPIFMAILGGARKLYGPILGAIVFTYLQEILTTRIPYYYMLFFGLLMVFVITFLPEGIVGIIDRRLKTKIN
ncbi:MAG: branched-chain amino acid ABC transporter permease [Deltaproteobacteria bacterium]|nr:branched-chain amino acid ABC transporter permease [Deltaproteobacteria bacterium]